MESLVSRAQKVDGLELFRKESWQKLQTLDTEFRFVSLRELYASSFDIQEIPPLDKKEVVSAIFPECKHSHLIFVNGIFSSELSDISALPSSLVLAPFEEAFSTHGTFLEQALHRAIQEETDPFALLNLAIQRQGVLLYVPPKLNIEVPLQCLYVETGSAPHVFSPRLHLVLGAHTQLRCIATSHSLNDSFSHLNIPVTDYLLEEGARLEIQDTVSSAWCMASLRASLKRQAHLSFVRLTRGSFSCRQSLRVYLKGEGAETTLKGLSLLSGSHASHIQATVVHEAPHTRSTQLFKGLLEGTSRFSFSGKIVVDPIAQKTEAYQLHKSLLLSPHARVHSQPNLEIGADDVKASHGATIAELEGESLFYLQTRGLDKNTAKKLLIQGFCEEIFHAITSNSLLDSFKTSGGT